MNKIFKVIWCSSSQAWVAVSELSKVKPVSSVSSVKKTSSAVSTLLKTTALAIPFALSPLAAHAYVAIGSTNNSGYAVTSDGASAHQVMVQIKPGHTIIKTQVIDLTIMQIAQVIDKILMQIMGHMQKELQLVKILQYKVQEVPQMVLLLVILQKLQVV